MTTQGSQRKSSFSESELKLLNLLSKQDEYDVDALAEALDVSSEEVIHIAKSLFDKGYRIKNDQARGVLRLFADGENGEIKYPDVSETVDHFRIGVLAETRVGSKQQQPRLMKGAYEHIFAHLGVAFIMLIGNVFAGKPDTGSSRMPIRPDLFLFSAEEQRDFALEHFPVAGKKIKTYMLAGTRDLTFFGKHAYSIVKDLCERRADFVYAGSQTGTFFVRGLRIIVKNPYDDRGPQGKTYGVQKIADSLSDPHPDILLVAGMHRYGWVADYWNDGFGFVGMVPSMHTQMTRQITKAAPVSPDVGVAVLDINFNEKDVKGRPKINYIGYNLNPYADYSNVGHLESHPQYNEGDLSEEEKKILKHIHEASEFGITVGEISRRLKLNRKKVEAAVERFQGLGHSISIPADIKRVVMKQELRKIFPAIEIAVERETSVGMVSDTHLTSTHQQIKLLERAYVRFSERKIKHILHFGDVSEGAPSVGYRGHARDVEGGNIDRLLDYVVDGYPSIRFFDASGTEIKGMTHAIDGNHDWWIVAQGGLGFVRALAKERQDINYLGSQHGAVIIDDVYYYLVHPRGGSGDTLSRKLEKHIKAARNRVSKGKGYPRVFGLGNWHLNMAFFDRETLGFLVPCMKSEDEFHATLALVPKLGFWIVTLGIDSKRNILSFNPEYFGFTEEDIDPNDYLDIHKWEIEQATTARHDKAHKGSSFND